MLDMGIVMGMGQFLFQVPLRGSLLLLVGLSALFLIAIMGQGLLISVTSDNQLQAFQMAMMTTFLPSFLLSGFVFAIYLMPLPLRIISLIVPARYVVTISFWWGGMRRGGRMGGPKGPCGKGPPDRTGTL